MTTTPRLLTCLAVVSLTFTAPAEAAGQWRDAGALTFARALHTLSPLADGGALVAGGRGCPGAGRGSLAFSGERFDADTGTWSLTSPMNIARDRHAAAVLSDGRVLVAGGQFTIGACMSRVHVPIGQTAEIYDPATDGWTRTGLLATAHVNPTATTLQDGRVLLAGGERLQVSEIFDPATGAWRTTGALRFARSGHTATRLADGRVLVIGGSTFPVAEIYDPATETWSTTVSSGEPHAAHASVQLGDGRVLVTGGISGTTIVATAKLYDPAADTWTTAAPMLAARGFHSLSRLADGRVLAAGGSSALGGTPLASAEIYDPATNTWTAADPMAAGHTSHTAAPLADGSILIVAGGYEEIGFTATAERFVP